MEKAINCKHTQYEDGLATVYWRRQVHSLLISFRKKSFLQTNMIFLPLPVAKFRKQLTSRRIISIGPSWIECITHVGMIRQADEANQTRKMKSFFYTLCQQLGHIELFKALQSGYATKQRKTFWSLAWHYLYTMISPARAKSEV